MKQSTKDLISREMKRLSIGGGLMGEAAMLSMSLKKIHKVPLGPESEERNFTDGEIVEFNKFEKTRNNIVFNISKNREIWLSQIHGLYFTIRESDNEYDLPTFIMKSGQKIKLNPLCDLGNFINLVKNKKFKIQQMVDFKAKVSFSRTHISNCSKAHDMVKNENDEFIGFDNLIDYCLDKLNNSNQKDLCDGYFVKGRLYYFYEV